MPLRRFAVLFFLAICLAHLPVQAAYLRNVPQELHQPDGAPLRCFASGDEHFNWLHDADGYVIIQDPKSGYYVYADKVGGALVPTAYVVGEVRPASVGLEKELRPSPEWLMENAWNAAVRAPGDPGNVVMAPSTGTINNIAVFIRFSGEAEFTDNYATVYDAKFNDTSVGAVSMKSYFQAVSYDTLTIQTYGYPDRSGSTVVSYQDSHTRAYFQPYNATTNPIGYQGGNNGTERRDREHILLKNAADAVASQVPPALVVDSDSDGYVDNVCFIIKGSPGGWSDLLWPHRWALYSQSAYINGKRVWDYNFQLQASFAVGVLCHEMFHSLGSPDLYHYYYGTSLTPVYTWDIMEYDQNPPQHMGAYMKFRYGQWISSIPQITTSGTYTLNPITSSTNNCYKIASPNSSSEYFVLEYRKKAAAGIESTIPGSGLLVYRINSNFDGEGNASYNPPSVGDEVYLYRPGGTISANGSPSTAHFSSDVSRTSINDSTNPSSWLWNSGSGGPGGLSISNVTSADSTISFTVCNLSALPAPTGVTATTDRCTDVQVSWHPVSGATSYNVRRGTTCGTAITTFTNVTSPYNDISAGAGTNYQYWVVAVNACGTSSNSSCAAGIRPATPAAPTGVTATANRCTDVRVAWNEVSGATGYNVYRGTTCWTVVTAFEGVASPFDDTTAATGTTYQYWVVASNDTCTSSNSSCAAGVRTATPVSPADTLRITKSDLDSALDWSDCTGASSYNVKRNDIPGADPSNFSIVAAPSASAYLDTASVPNGAVWWYQIEAVNGSCVTP